MKMKYYPLLVLLSHCVSCGIDLFFLKNRFKYLNDLLNLESYLNEFVTKTRWIEQKLDHFNSSEARVWKMKYFERLSFSISNGPIYLFLGAESPASPRWADTGIMYELAKETHGAMYVSEHRYYGDSKPLNGTNAETFKYLSARQALEDNMNLLRYLKRKPNYRESKVVVIGGSYSGNLAAWMKLLYPDLVDAAIASSGPVLAKKDFYEYLEKVRDNYEQYGTRNCIGTIRKIFERYDRLMRTTKGIELLKREENICEECDLTVPENRQLFFSHKVGSFMGKSQYGTTKEIHSHCQELQRPSIPTILPDASTTDRCICYDFDEMIKEFYKKDNDWILTWLYQTCNEFGYYQTTSSDKTPFTNNIPLEFYLKMCHTLYGPDFDEGRVDAGVTAVNALFKGLNPNVTNVVFSNGDLDPWSTLSILEDLSYNAPAVVIPRASHCMDLFSNKITDMEELKESRKYIKNLIKQWIGDEQTIASI